MFASAIETVSKFTRPIHFIVRNFGSDSPRAGAATLFFVNADGWALTCAHVAREIAVADAINKKYAQFKDERSRLSPNPKKYKKQLNELARRYAYTGESAIELKCRFLGCIEGTLDMAMTIHNSIDMALIKFNGFDRLLCNEFPVFGADSAELLQGRSICRLGFPFPEFTNFRYDSVADSTDWTPAGRDQSPRFPLDGMLTRHCLDENGRVTGFEVSTPGLRGQSGGAAFGTDGRVWGMQSMTRHLDLDFDVDTRVWRNGKLKTIRDSAFLHVGVCVHVDILKDFMRQHEVTFNEE